MLICHPDNINLFTSKVDLKKKLKKNNYDGLLFVFDEDAQTNTSETHTGRAILKNNTVSEIIEKTIKIKNSKRLAGIYHFSKWADYLKYSKQTIKDQPPINGRHFISQVYNEYLKDKKKINIFNVKKHITFGLVSYINEYNFWYNYFKFNIKKRLKYNFNFLNLIPSCGDGSRFLQNDKDNFKPLINVDGKSMIAKTIDSLPKSIKNTVIIRDDHNKKYHFKKRIKNKVKNLDVMILKNKTSGMATTCYEYLKSYKKKNPILISSCDYAVVFDEEKLKKIIDFFDPDVIIWTFKNYPDARIAPFAYAYCEINNGKVTKISEKTPISDKPHLDHIAQGIFYFKSNKIFMKAFKKMIRDKNKINNEYYVGNSINQLIKDNYHVIPFEVEQYICLGTLQDLKVYNFWSDYFND
ncbi:MAG: hypothetical protein CMM99_04870 [Rickettsiales bacterium]|nr:hypothetical protein [Rickettsiales bacterium]